MIISRSCLRICYFGGSADYYSFFSRQSRPTLMLGTGINKYCYVSVNKLPDVEDTEYLIAYSSFEKVKNIYDIKNNGVKGTLKYLKEIYPNLGKLAIYISNPDISPKSGTGSSSAMISSLLNCIHNLYGIKPTKNQLAKECILVERSLDYCGESGGIGDQIFINYSGLSSITINDDSYFYVRPLGVSEDFIRDFNRSHLLFYLSDRNSFEIAKSHDNVEADKYKSRIVDIAYEAKKYFDIENIPMIGKLLEESWQEKRQISSLISNQRIDEIHDAAIAKGAWGAKLLGSGGNGLMLILAEPSLHSDIISSIKLPTIQMGFDSEGSKIIFHQNE